MTNITASQIWLFATWICFLLMYTNFLGVLEFKLDRTRYQKPNPQHPVLVLCANRGTASVLLLLYVLLFDLVWDNKKVSCVHSPVATATCRALLCSVCWPIAGTKIKGTSVWIPFGLLRKKGRHLVVIHRSLQKLSLCLKNVRKCFPDLKYTWEPVRYLEAMFDMHDYLPGQQWISVKHCSKIRIHWHHRENAKNLEYWWVFFCELWTR